MSRIQAVYLSLFGRPADVAGLAFWERISNGGNDLSVVLPSLASSAEYRSRFDGLVIEDQVQAVYLSLFNRRAEPEGLSYWVEEIKLGRASIGDLAMRVLDGAQGHDLATIANRLAFCTHFTSTLEELQAGSVYRGPHAASVLRDFINGIGATTDTSAFVHSSSRIVSVLQSMEFSVQTVLSAPITEDSTLASGLSSPAVSVFKANDEILVYLHPSLFFTEPLLPAIELIITQNMVTAASNVQDLTLGAMRDFDLIEMADGTSALVLVDHGLELREGDWPYGHVLIGKIIDGNMRFERVSDTPAFNHSVATGDFNRDGLSDIVVVHMGVKAGGTLTNLHGFLQSRDGNFSQDPTLFASIAGSFGAGAVNIFQAGLHAGTIVLANYGPSGKSDWGAFRLIQEFSGSSTITYIHPREGAFVSGGATQVEIADLNNDGRQEILFALEGKNFNAIEIFEPTSTGYRRATDDYLSVNRWSFDDLQFREFLVSDINGDGFQDVVLQGWRGRLLNPDGHYNTQFDLFINQAGVYDFGSMLLINDQRENLIQQIGHPNLSVNIDDAVQYFRVLDVSEGRLQLIGMADTSSPFIATISHDVT